MTGQRRGEEVQFPGLTLSAGVRQLLQETRNKLSGSDRRMFMARTVRLLGKGGQRKAQQELGWCRDTIRKGEWELCHGSLPSRLSTRGRKKAEDRLPRLREDITTLVEPETQTDPTFRTVQRYRRVTAPTVRQRLIAEQGYTDEELPTERTLRNILELLRNNNRFLKGPGKVPTIYIGNHDHSHVAWQAGARDNVGSNLWYRTQPYAIALFTSPGAVMIQNGQEFAEDHWIVDDDKGSSRRVQPRPLRWSFKHDTFGKVAFHLYKRLCEIRKTYQALRSNNFYPENWEEWQTTFNPQGYGVDVEKQVVIYHRWGYDHHGNLQRFIIVLNFSHEEQTVNVPFSENGQWTDLLSFKNGQWGTWKPIIHNYNMPLRIGRCWGHIFYQ